MGVTPSSLGYDKCNIDINGNTTATMLANSFMKSEQNPMGIEALLLGYSASSEPSFTLFSA